MGVEDYGTYTACVGQCYKCGMFNHEYRNSDLKLKCFQKIRDVEYMGQYQYTKPI